MHGSKFEIRNSKFEITNRPGDPVLAKFSRLRPAEKALPSLIYILSATTKCGPKLLCLDRTGWGAAPHWIGLQKSSFGPNFDIGEFYDRGRPCTRGLRTIAARASMYVVYTRAIYTTSSRSDYIF